MLRTCNWLPLLKANVDVMLGRRPAMLQPLTAPVHLRLQGDKRSIEPSTVRLAFPPKSRFVSEGRGMPRSREPPALSCQDQECISLFISVCGYLKGSKEVGILVLAWKPWTLYLM